MEVIGKFESYNNEKIIFKKLRVNKKTYGQYEIELAEFDLVRWVVRPAIFALVSATVVGYFSSTTYGYAVLTLLFLFFVSRIMNKTKKVNVLYIPTVGVQETITSMIGTSSSNIYQIENIEDIIINENITYFLTKFYLCLIYNEPVSDEEVHQTLKPLLISVQPKLDLLKIVYEEMHSIIKTALGAPPAAPRVF